MSAFQEQSLILSLVCLAATVLFYGFARSPGGSWLSNAITLNLAALAVIFGAFVAIEVEGYRAEIAASLVAELPFGIVVASLCLAQAGYLPLRIGGPPLAVVAGRPRLRILLAGAGLALPVIWALAAVFGFLWPSPAVQALAPAPPQFVVFKVMLMAPAALCSGLCAALFLWAAGSASLDARLRLKNAAFAIATWCLAMVAIESAVFACVRAWLPDDQRVATLNMLLTVETVLAISCVGAFIVGVALRYTPAVTVQLVRHVATRWLPEQDRFDSFKWHAVVGGVARGVASATRRIKVTAARLDLSETDVQRAIGTLQHIAAMSSGSYGTDAAVTPARARDLHGLQAAVVQDVGLVRRLGEFGSGNSTVTPGPWHASSLHVELDAALDLVDHAPEGRSDDRERPLWFYLAAVGAADVDLLDATRVRSLFGGEVGYREVSEAYWGEKACGEGLRR